MFLLIFNGYRTIYDYVGGIRDPLKQSLANEFCRKQNKVISVLTETHINHDQIHHIKNEWLGLIFFSPGDSHTKGILALLYLGLSLKDYKIIWKVKMREIKIK